MSELGYLAALVLAAAFGWAGVAKARTPRTTARTFAGLGLPAPAALARAVPAVELTLAAALVVVPGWAAAVALALLAAFTTFLARAVRAGVDVGCGCFGSNSTEPVSSVELVRNGLLASCGLLALAAPAPVAPSLAAVLVVGLAMAMAAVVLALADLRRRVGSIWRMELL